MSSKIVNQKTVEILKKELHDMCTEDSGAFYEKDGNSEPKERVREIGRILNDIGGFNLMSDIGTTITRGTNQRELEFAWSGINEFWQA
jgi:hypothetical protein